MIEDIWTQPTWVEINLDNLGHNYRQLRKMSGDAKVIGVVKANAYGHGAVQVARELTTMGAEYLAVATPSEAKELREQGIDAPLFTMGFATPEAMEYLVANAVESCVYSLDTARGLSEVAQRQGRVHSIHIKLDTGMGRIGYRPCEASFLEIQQIANLPNLRMRGLFTHFASADEEKRAYTIRQYQSFINSSKRLEELGVRFDFHHVDNDAAVMQYPFQEQLVRLGIGLYGMYPSEHIRQIGSEELRPVLSLYAIVTHVKTIEAGDSIGYGQTFFASKPTRVATVGIGYADALNRSLVNKGSFRIHGQAANILGRVCMDQTMVDVTEIPDVKVGDTVTICGGEGQDAADLDELCDCMGINSYEFLSKVGFRVPRVYIKGNKVVDTVSYLKR